MTVEASAQGPSNFVTHWAGHALTVKALLIGMLALALLIPIYLINTTIDERQQRYTEAVRDIGKAWGLPQQLSGPVLNIPYLVNNGDGPPDRRMLTVLPDSLRIDATVMPETRYRGLFQAVVYVVDVEMVGEFAVPAVDYVARRAAIQWNAANLTLDVSDARNLVIGPGDTQIDGRNLTLDPVASSSKDFATQLSGQVASELAPGTRLPFRFKLRLNGSDGLSFLPLGKATSVSVKAPWGSPSFFGAFLPADRGIDDKTFEARWQVSYLGRGFPQFWSEEERYGKQDAINRSSFGVNFLQTVSPYRETDRAVKYGILFVALTFTVYLLFEIASGQSIHLMQYGAVGLALCVFYLLLLSLSEQMGFGVAYGISAAAVVVQTSIYTYATTRRPRYAQTFAGLLAGLYAFLYVLLKMESYSLLSGSLALFLALSVLMYLTRNLNRMRGAQPTVASGA